MRACSFRNFFRRGLFCFLLFSVFFKCSPENSGNEILLNLPEPGIDSDVFAPGLISTLQDEHSAPAISHDGRDMLWAVYVDSLKRPVIKWMHRDETGWSRPVIAPFSGLFWDDAPVFAPKSRRLYFSSKRPYSAAGHPNADPDLWWVERRANGWGRPVRLPFNTRESEAWCSIAKNGNIYFTGHYAAGLGKGDLYVAEYVNGAYRDPVNLGEPVNSAGYELTPCIDEDERFLLYSSFQPGKPSGLFLSRRKKGGGWGRPMFVNPFFNPPHFKKNPGFTPDERHFFFVSKDEAKKQTDIYWISADLIKKLKSKYKDRGE